MSNASLLQNVYLFKDLNPQELEQVGALSQSETYGQGDEVFSEGDVARSVYVIKYGSVKVKQSAKDNQINVATLATGSHFGEMAFVDGEKRSATIEAAEKSEIVTIDFDALKRLLAQNPLMAMKVYRSMATFLCGRLRVTTSGLSLAREKTMRHF